MSLLVKRERIRFSLAVVFFSYFSLPFPCHSRFRFGGQSNLVLLHVASLHNCSETKLPTPQFALYCRYPCLLLFIDTISLTVFTPLQRLFVAEAFAMQHDENTCCTMVSQSRYVQRGITRRGVNKRLFENLAYGIHDAKRRWRRGTQTMSRLGIVHGRTIRVILA